MHVVNKGLIGGSEVPLKRAGLPILRFGVQIPARTDIRFEISAPPAPLNQLNYDEYTDRPLSA